MMQQQSPQQLEQRVPADSLRMRLAHGVDGQGVQRFIMGVIFLNAVVLGLETEAGVMERWGAILHFIDRLCLTIFVIELTLKMVAYRGLFWRSGWNWFDFLVVGIALVPGAGPWAVLRSLRVLRVLRLLTVVPSLQRVVAAFIHSIPGLSGVVAVMAIFFYTMAVLATNLFGESFPQWFGGVGPSLFSLFQIMTLESWSMGIVRPVMETYPWAWAFFVPFIMVATFTILNLFIGIIVSTMQELSLPGHPATAQSFEEEKEKLEELLGRLERDLAEVRQRMARRDDSKKVRK